MFALVCTLLLGSFAVMRARRHARPVGARARRTALLELAKGEPTGANYLLIGDASVELGDYDGARHAYIHAAAIYRSKNMPSEGYVAERLAQRYEVQVTPYIHFPVTPGSLTSSTTKLAKFEPVYGCYTGAFIDHEDAIRGTYRDEYGEWRRDASAFNHLTNVHHAIFFMYLGYGRSFPAKFVRHLNDNGAAAQIAFEPDRLSSVRDDAYLHRFARQARKSRTPIFLRFASEMNGDWTPYHRDPALYIEKFQLVARVMHAEAPNVAMVWCPFETPARLIPDYYPGPEAVDWVGINIYSVPFWDNNPKHPADWRNPSDSLRNIYRRYADRHPIMICEYGASHRCSLDPSPRDDFAKTKMTELYTALPRLYPRIKAVCWLSMNAIKHAIPGHQNNDYSLLGDDEVRKQYSRLLLDPYFLPKVSRRAPKCAPQETVALRDDEVIARPTSLSAWVKLYDEHPRVVWRVNGELRQDSSAVGAHRWVLDPATVPDGRATIDLTVEDESGRVVAEEVRHVFCHSASLAAATHSRVMASAP
jgi:hypothetical protein